MSGEERNLLTLLFEAGPTLRGPMGEVPLTWQELDAFARRTGTLDEPWECRALLCKSVAYTEGIGIGERPFGFMPMEMEGSG